ncbi:unnamed protein product [Malus baccata var. baccata]
MQTERDGTEPDGTGRDGEGGKMPSVENKEEEEGDEDVIILCSTNLVPPILGAPNARRNALSHSVPSHSMYQTIPKILSLMSPDLTGGETERKFTQNSFSGTACSTHFRRTKREGERLVPFRSVLFHVPNDTKDSISHVT